MNKQKTQILYIHGGETFASHKKYLYFLRHREISLSPTSRWYGAYLDKKLGQDFDIIRPLMPLKENAKYSDWKLHFERYFPKLTDNIILIGGSLGGTFLAKYLSENKFPKKILATYLVCTPFDNTLPHHDLVGGFVLPKNLSLLEKQSPQLYLIFSKNDAAVPVSQAKKYAAKLKNANILIYNHIKGHFQISEFPEIVKLIKQNKKNS